MRRLSPLQTVVIKVVARVLPAGLLDVDVHRHPLSVSEAAIFDDSSPGVAIAEIEDEVLVGDAVVMTLCAVQESNVAPAFGKDGRVEAGSGVVTIKLTETVSWDGLFIRVFVLTQ